jgi:hypothetical protein
MVHSVIIIKFEAWQYQLDCIEKKIFVINSYLVPSAFKPEHHQQLEDLIWNASKDGTINKNLRNMEEITTADKGLRSVGKDHIKVIEIKFEQAYDNDIINLQSIEAIITPFYDKNFCVICLRCSNKTENINYYHPFPESNTKQIKESELVDELINELIDEYKKLYPKYTIKLVSFHDISLIINDPEKRKFFKYSTPSYKEIKPIPNSYEVRIAELEAEIDRLKEIISTNNIMYEGKY